MRTEKIITFISAAALVVMLLLTCVSQAVFGNMNYFRKEFEKYNVTQNIDMEMDDIMYVMDELMDYLHGDRENLENIVTEVNGETRDFFTEREKTHMADCKVLFDGGFAIRKGAAVVFVALTLLLVFKKKFSLRRFLKYAALFSVIIAAGAGILAVAASIDFNACFIVFHKLFFNNDLWILDPAEDLIINIPVKPFFADMALKIALYCAAVLAVIVITGAGIYLSDKKRRNL